MGKDVQPFLLRDGGEAQLRRKKQTGRKPRAHEKTVAEGIGGRRQPGSGASESAKGDVRRDAHEFPLLVECKRTSGQRTLRVDAEWLAKITREAHARGSYPALSIQFDEDIVRALAGSPEATWVALPLSVMRGLLEKAGEDTKL